MTEAGSGGGGRDEEIPSMRAVLDLFIGPSRYELKCIPRSFKTAKFSESADSMT